MFNLIFVCLAYLTLSKSSEVPMVEIQQGFLSGQVWQSFKGRSFAAFTGIPFAKPPLGELRFEAPVPIDPWKGIFNATLSHNVCPQIDLYDANRPVIGDEDCLYLNVYTPSHTSVENYLPVMFYIHGGTGETGSAKPEWLSPKYLLDKDIVLVLANYRIGALGFLSTGDKILPGNNGLKDQNLALIWVKSNIARFGGDPDKVTVFGNSHGGLYSHLHTMSPLSAGLVNRAILQSGCGTAYFALQTLESASENANQLGKLLNCCATTSAELISCLRAVKVVDIIQQSTTFKLWDNDTVIPFRPIIDGVFLTESPKESIKLGRTSNISYMMGVVAQEYANVVANYNAHPHLLKTLDKCFNFIIPIIFGIASDKLNSSRRIRSYYLGKNPIDGDTRLELTNMYSDAFYDYPHSRTISLHSKFTNNSVYQYLFDYRGSISFADRFGDSFKYGACHTDELLYLFTMAGHMFPNYKPTENDIKVMEALTTLWTNFATTGNPTPENELLWNSTKWESIGKEGLEYYHIRNYNDLSMNSKLFSDRMNFWNTLPILDAFRPIEPLELFSYNKCVKSCRKIQKTFNL